MTENNIVNFKKLSENACIPFKASKYAAGHDLCASESCILEPGKSSWIETGISLSIPENYYGRIASRSSLAAKDISVFAGIVDRDYRGE